jgi:hypothetical protein
MALPGYSAARGTSGLCEKLCCPDDPLQRRADRLVERVDALAEALRAGGVSEEASAELLSQASSAILQALRLELLGELGA